ncbi:hypothetical protein SNE40_009402 [Patella caerulea]|uniref:G-protein coupled receptors family 2 profile 2 domain-containing protein n=1 Tax=Patella caerulea TaxID=87958 RepID=A0AAN8Q375_PATCE
MLLQAYLLFGALLLVESKDRRRKPPTRTLGMSPEPHIDERNETEIFFAKVIYNHSRYCSSDSVCENAVFASDSCPKCNKCQCDKACSYYGDCCPDVALRQPSQVNKTFDCVSSLVESIYPVELFELRVNENEKFYMTATCPSNDNGLKAKCFNSTASEPVTTMDNTTTYKNQYCALCHNVTNTRKWKMSIECHLDTNLNDAYSTLAELVNNSIHHPNCTVKFKAPYGVTTRTCFNGEGTISKCNATGLWSQYDEFVENACHSYRTIQEVDGIFYNNPFCFICNTENPERVLKIKCKRHRPLNTPSFTALLDFSDVIYGSDEITKSQCPTATVYDQEKKECRKIACSMGRELRNQTCKSILGESSGNAYSVYFSLTLDNEISLKENDGVLSDLPVVMEQYIRAVLLGNQVNIHDRIIAFNTTGAYGNCSHYTSQIFFSANLVISEPVFQDDFEQKLLSLRNTTFVIQTESQNFTFTTSVSEEAHQLQTYKKQSKSTSCMTVSAVSYNEKHFESSEYTSVNGLLMCPQIILNQDEFHVDEYGLHVKWTNEIISSDQYEQQDDGHVKICLHNFKAGDQEILDGSLGREASTAEVWVSRICTILSLLCLLLAFIVYCVFKSLRSMPGRNNMNLIVALFLAQLLYLVGAGRTEIKGVCEAMAMFIHYFWLAAFCAMNVCSFHMFRVFTTMSRDDSADRRRRFLQYSIYIYGLPAVLVAATLVVHIVATDSGTTGYGGANVCYLSSALAILIAFGLPVAITVVSNSIFFIITLRSIKNRPKIEKNKQDEHHSAVYIKLSTLTGMTWTIGFIAIITRIVALSYIFIIINASQGVFLFISFVCNERVKKLIMEGGKSSSSSGYTRSTTKTNTTVSVVAGNMRVRPEK